MYCLQAPLKSQHMAVHDIEPNKMLDFTSPFMSECLVSMQFNGGLPKQQQIYNMTPLHMGQLSTIQVIISAAAHHKRILSKHCCMRPYIDSP